MNKKEIKKFLRLKLGRSFKVGDWEKGVEITTPFLTVNREPVKVYIEVICERFNSENGVEHSVVSYHITDNGFITKIRYSDFGCIDDYSAAVENLHYSIFFADYYNKPYYEKEGSYWIFDEDIESLRQSVVDMANFIMVLVNASYTERYMEEENKRNQF